MQIQMWEGAVLGCTETVPRSTTPDTAGQSVGCADKVSGKAWLKTLNEEICSVKRRRGMGRAETREEFELQRVSSCCSGDQRRRAELDFDRCQPFDDLHGATTLGTAPKTRRVFCGSKVLFRLRFLG
jgi:hypothetical protein